MDSDVALALENVYHKILLKDCVTEEKRKWEEARHSIMEESIKQTIDYYAKRYYVDPLKNEKEITNTRKL